MPRTITLVGARGGQGTTTVAAALAMYASHANPTVLVSSDPAAAAALIGVPVGVDGEWSEITETLALAPAWTQEAWATHTVVVDAGRVTDEPPCPRGESYAVLRGPCYVALATLLARTTTRFNGIILVAESERSLTARDVTDVLDIPVVATVTVSPHVARAIDAGLLATRLPRLRELGSLRTICPTRPLTPEKKHTDLPLSPCDNGAEASHADRSRRASAANSYVDGSCALFAGLDHAEHRASRAGCRRLLRRRGRDLGRGLLHGPGRGSRSMGGVAVPSSRAAGRRATRGLPGCARRSRPAEWSTAGPVALPSAATAARR